jgi:hypothetical protein
LLAANFSQQPAYAGALFSVRCLFFALHTMHHAPPSSNANANANTFYLPCFFFFFFERAALLGYVFFYFFLLGV